MNKSVIKFPHKIFQALKEYLLEDKNEKHAFIFGTYVRGDKGITILAQKVVGFNLEDIKVSPTSVRIDRTLVTHLFEKFVVSGADVLISCHSHPFDYGNVSFSHIDDENDRNLFEYFNKEIKKYKKDALMYTMVFGQKSIAARGYENGEFFPVDKIVHLTYPIEYIYPTNAKRASTKIEQLYHRQVLAFGDEAQEIFSQLKVSLIGAGGTGSILAEALVRLGVREICIVDHDKIEESNLNRWQGGGYEDIGRYKVDVLQERIKRIREDLSITTFTKTLFNKDVIDHIKDSDVIIGAVDSNSARFLLNQISLCYLIPYLDCSSGIIVKDGTIQKLASRNVVVIPGLTECFDCNDNIFYDKAKVSYEFNNYLKEEAERRKYIQGADIKSPSVYAINMLTVSTLLLEFMNIFIGYKKQLYWNVMIDYMALTQEAPRAYEYRTPSTQCINCNDRLAKGDQEQIWHLFAPKVI